ncbi:MAG TPA: hypothetical protein VL769_04520 [Acidimicrobiia bacterium]|nr:hypothetical protein [Acidimicrobiia bacterium]
MLAESESSVASRWRDRVRGREALIAFVAIEVGALPLLLFFGRHAWFTKDDWDFLSARTAGDLGDWFRDHFQHLVTLPVLIYRLLWVLFGIRTYVPYLVLVIVTHLAVAALVRVLLRRLGVRPWLATVMAGSFVLFGAGGENILVAFQITFGGSLLFGLLHLVLADHDGPIDRRDRLGLLAGFAGLLCSGVAVPMTIVVGLTVLLRRGRRGWRIALFHTAPIGIAYIIWTVAAPKGPTDTNLRSHSPVQMIKFVRVGIEAAFGGLGQLPGVGIALFVLLVVGLALAIRSRAKGERWFGDGRAAPVALVVGAVLFLFMTAATRSGQGGNLVLLKDAGPVRARESRYVYLIAAMCLPAIGLAAEMLIRKRKALAVPIAALLLVGLPANVNQLSDYSPHYATPSGTRLAILSLPRLPLSAQLRNTHTPYPDSRLSVEGLTVSWLIDSADKIPDPGPVKPGLAAGEVLQFLVQPSSSPSPGFRCTRLTKPFVRVIGRRHTFTVERGFAYIRYAPAIGVMSPLRKFAPDTYRALVGPLRLKFFPLDKGVDVCV